MTPLSHSLSPTVAHQHYLRLDPTQDSSKLLLKLQQDIQSLEDQLSKPPLTGAAEQNLRTVSNLTQMLTRVRTDFARVLQTVLAADGHAVEMEYIQIRALVYAPQVHVDEKNALFAFQHTTPDHIVEYVVEIIPAQGKSLLDLWTRSRERIGASST